MNKSVYEDLMSAIKAIGPYCSAKKHPDPTSQYFYTTEFYNEGWMLKLVLARLLECQARNLSKELQCIRDSVAKGWMSEGRLSAAFTHEQCTHADAVLGDVERRPKTKWGVQLKEGAGDFTVIEAKLGSTLAKQTKNAKFDQAARNLACMAYALMSSRKENQVINAHFYVVMPKDDKRYKQVESQFDKNGFEVKDRVRKEVHKNNAEHQLIQAINKDTFIKLVNSIDCCLLTWDDICKQLGDKDLFDYYTRAVNANGIRLTDMTSSCLPSLNCKAV